MKPWSNNTSEKIGIYVYILTYVENDIEKVFYVGKGQSSRVFEHFNAAGKLKSSGFDESKLSEKITTIIKKKCNAYIVAANLRDEIEALKIESVLIDVLKFIKDADIQNIVAGHHSFGITPVNQIEHKYSQHINFAEYIDKNKLNAIVFKSTYESFEACINKDFRGVLEGLWKIDPHKLSKADLIIGVHNQTVYGVYSLVPGSIKRVSFMKQDEFDKWLSEHKDMGRPSFAEYYLPKFDKGFSSRMTFKLNPLATINSSVGIFEAAPKKLKTAAEFLLNKTFDDEVMYGRYSFNYFGFKTTYNRFVDGAMTIYTKTGKAIETDEKGKVVKTWNTIEN